MMASQESGFASRHNPFQSLDGPFPSFDSPFKQFFPSRMGVGWHRIRIRQIGVYGRVLSRSCRHQAGRVVDRRWDNSSVEQFQVGLDRALYPLLTPAQVHGCSPDIKTEHIAFAR